MLRRPSIGRVELKQGGWLVPAGQPEGVDAFRQDIPWPRGRYDRACPRWMQRRKMSDLSRPHEIAKQHASGSRGDGGGSFAGEVLKGVVRAFLLLLLFAYGMFGLLTHSAHWWLDFWRCFALIMMLGSWGYLYGTTVMRLIIAIRGKPFEWRKAPTFGEMINGWLGVGLLVAPWIPGAIIALIFHGHGHGHAVHVNATTIAAIVINVLFFGSIIGGIVYLTAKRRAGSNMGVQTHVPQQRGVSPLLIPFGMLALVFSRIFFTSRGSSPGHPGVNHNPFDNDDHNSGSGYSE